MNTDQPHTRSCRDAMQQIKDVLFPQEVDGITDDAYYNLSGVEYAIKDQDVGKVDLKTVQRVMGQLQKARLILNAPVSEIETPSKVVPEEIVQQIHFMGRQAQMLAEEGNDVSANVMNIATAHLFYQYDRANRLEMEVRRVLGAACLRTLDDTTQKWIDQLREAVNGK